MRTILSAAAALAVGLGTTAASAQTLQMWTTEEQLDRLQTQRGIAASFEKATGIAVEVIPVTESELGQRVTAAFAAGDLPDVIYHPLQYVQPWAEAGILDIDAATEVIEDIGEDSFAPGALRMADVDGDFAAVPVDGWTQMLLYRADLFEENGLAPPATYEAVLAAVEALHNPPEMFGFVAGTKVDEAYMSQMLEHVLLANGATPVGEDGISGFEPGPLREALEFYKAIADASPPGELYWQQSRELYSQAEPPWIILVPTPIILKRARRAPRDLGAAHPHIQNRRSHTIHRQRPHRKHGRRPTTPCPARTPNPRGRWPHGPSFL